MLGMSRKSHFVIIAVFSILLIALTGPTSAFPGSPPGTPSALDSLSQLPPAAQNAQTTGAIQSLAAEPSILTAIEKIFRIAAYIIGALWVYFNFWRGRTYRARIEPLITGRILNREGSQFVNVVLTLRNVGLSKVDIEQKGTALRLLSYDPSNTNDPWKHHSTISILLNHDWIEPQETVREHLLIPFSENNLIAARVEVILVSKKTMWEDAIILT